MRSSRRWLLAHDTGAGDSEGAIADVHGFVQSFAATETEPAIESHGALVLGRHFQERLAKTRTAKTFQGLEQEGAAQAAAAVKRAHSQVLDRAHARTVADPLYGSAVTVLGGNEPGGMRNKAST